MVDERNYTVLRGVCQKNEQMTKNGRFNGDWKGSSKSL